MQHRHSKPRSQVASPKIASCHNSYASDINSYQSSQVWNYSKWDTEFCILFSRWYHSASATEIWLEAFWELVCLWTNPTLSLKFNKLVWHLLGWMRCISKLNTAHLWLPCCQSGLDTTVSLSLEFRRLTVSFCNTKGRMRKKKRNLNPVGGFSCLLVK